MPPPTVAQLIDDPRHSGLLDGAIAVGQAELGDWIIVRVGLWLDGEGAVRRARFRATTCASLVAYAEAACALAEAGRVQECITAATLRAAVAGVHPVHHDRADAVALAFSRALARRTRPPQERSA